MRIPQRYEHCSLENYQPLTVSQAHALAVACRFADRYPNVARGLFFSGGTGIGKTHLAVGILRELLQRLYEDVLYMEFGSFLEAASTTHDEMRTTWERAEKVSLLVMDDFGVAAPLRENLDRTQELLRARFRAHRPTILTGEAIRCRDFFRGVLPANPSATQLFLSALPAKLVMDLMSNVKLLCVNGEDFRQKSVRNGAVFQATLV